MKAQSTIFCGAILAFFAVAIGAFGAHAWQAILQAHATSTIFATASQYHFIHALGLLWLGLYQTLQPSQNSNTALSWTAILFLCGTLIFSGSLYALALSGSRWLGAITPIGGLLLLAAWATLAWSVGLRHINKT